MPRVDLRRVSLTDHARKRILGREIPHDAIWGAVDHPFATRILPDGREVRTAPATVRSRRAWVSVVLERRDALHLRVITAYPRGRRGVARTA